MFKKIEIWILYLTILLSILFAIGFGVLVRQELVGSTKVGWISKTALSIAEIPVAFKKIFVDGGNSSDLVVEDKSPLITGFDGNPNNFESYLLLSRYNGDLKESIIELVDLQSFNVIHTWNPNIELFNSMIKQDDEFLFLNRDNSEDRAGLRHPILIKDGGLIFTPSNHAYLVKIDECSNIIFQNKKDLFHHSIEQDFDGNIWVPSHLYPQKILPNKVGRLSRMKGGYYDDAIVKLSPTGEISYEKSVSEIFIENGLEYLLFAVGDQGFTIDPIHLNDIQPVLFDSKHWKKGDIFLSLRHQSMIILYRPSTGKIISKLVGPFFHQHDIDILDDHRISIFNNNSKDFYDGDIVDGSNEVIIYNFDTNEYSNYLNESLIKYDIKTITQGRSQIINNKDLIVEETNYGRTFYFNSDGSLRWMHVNRASNEKVYVVDWSRILYTEKDIKIVNNFLANKKTCNE